MIVLFILFLFLLVIFFRNKSLALILSAIQVISFGGSFFLGRDIIIENLGDYGIVFMMIVILSLIVISWKDYYGVKNIIVFDESKLKFLTKVLVILNSYSFVILFVIAIIVQSNVKDINEFKYQTGVSEKFITANLPFPSVFFSIAIILSNFCFFLLPLHFYYLYRKKYLLSLVCLLLSTNSMLVGLTYFSRAVIIHFIFLYIGMLPLFYGMFDAKIKRTFKWFFTIAGAVFFVYFLDVSVRRFEEDSSSAKIYSKTIPVDAITQDPLTYSFIDYMSQGYINGYEVLQLYDGEGFNGGLTFEKITSLVSSPYDTYLRKKYREKLWPYHYSYSFNGFPAYVIYDYGIIGGLLFCLFYFMIVTKMKPKKGNLKLKNTFLITLLVQIPLLSIFYSEFPGLIISFILWIPLIIYLNIKLRAL